MPWEPAQSSSRASNRWRPPSPTPATPALPTPTLKRESWRPTSSWTPVARPDRPNKTEPLAAESSYAPAGRSSYPERAPVDRSPSSPLYRSRDLRSAPDDDAEYGRRGHGSKRGRRGGGGGGGEGSERSWEAWNNKVGSISSKRIDEDRRGGPSRRDDYTNFDRIREQKDQAAGRSWSAWKSKVGTGPDDRDRDRRQVETRGRNSEGDRGGREIDEGWKAKSKGEEGDRRTGSERREPEESRSWGTKREVRSRLDDRDEVEEGVPPPRRGMPETKERSALPYSPGSRSASPHPHKRTLSPVRGRIDESPKRGTARRPSPDYGRGPLKKTRSPSPPPKRRAPDRGSPDYALGAEGRDRIRDQEPGRPL